MLVENILSDHLMLQVVFTNDILVLLIQAGLGGVVVLVLVLVNDGLLLFAFTFLSLVPHLLLLSLFLLQQE